MKVILLKDAIDKTIDGVITSEDSGANEIQEVIALVKSRKPDNWGLADIILALPKDCTFHMANNIVCY